MRLESDAELKNEFVPESFTKTVDSLYAVDLREEITLSQIRPPQKLAPLSHAIGLEITPDDSLSSAGYSSAFGRLILLFDPESEHDGQSLRRIVAYIQGDMDQAVAADPLLPEVSWEWLTESLNLHNAQYDDLGGTVTSTHSVRFGDIGGPPYNYQVEMRASWTALEEDLSQQVKAFAHLLSLVSGLPPEGTFKIA